MTYYLIDLLCVICYNLGTLFKALTKETWLFGLPCKSCVSTARQNTRTKDPHYCGSFFYNRNSSLYILISLLLLSKT